MRGRRRRKSIGRKYERGKENQSLYRKIEAEGKMKKRKVASLDREEEGARNPKSDSRSVDL